MIYRGAKTRCISFPLGGIGSGCIGLAGNGRLVDWEIFNHPNKGSVNGFSHFAVRAEAEGRCLDARVLQGDLDGPHMGSSQLPEPFSGFGFGVNRASLSGVPHFQSADFDGAYPFATLRFAAGRFPGAVALTAFNPLIPLNDKDSSIPAAFFAVEITNTTEQTVTYTIVAALKNPVPRRPVSRLLQDDGTTLLTLTAVGMAAADPAYADLTVATDAPEVSYQRYWYRSRSSGWFDNLEVYWRDLTAPGPFVDRGYEDPVEGEDRPHDDHGLLAAHAELEPGETRTIRFVISWNVPNVVNDWNPEPRVREGQPPTVWRNYYATLFPDSRASAIYALRHWGRLYAETRRFHDALFSSTLPSAVLDAVSANLSTLKSPTVLRLEDGSFYGFEGCNVTSGSCEGSCTHVWNYAYALPFLFPALERSMRDLDYRYNLHPDGRMGFRLQLPLGRPAQDWHAAVDGQFGNVVKVYRDWKMSGDDAWLRSHWEAVKRSIAYAWSPTNPDRWDPERTGVLWGRQHHTLDTELFGPNAYLTGFYLAALKAAGDIAGHLGEPRAAAEYRALFARGRAWVERHLFNGAYYQQQLDLHDRAILAPYRAADGRFGSVDAMYWDEEHGELKHQIAAGCHVDQVVAQWHANLCGLGDIFDPDHVRAALRSIHAHNYKRSMRDVFNPCRVFALDDEAGVVICAWPEGARKPAVPLTYAEETMTGFEYAVAAHMIGEGLVEEGLEIVAAVRDRYDGTRRNPWNEFECGSNYARSMASYALLPALSGFEFDLTRGHIGFSPVAGAEPFRCMWSLDSAWGTYDRRGNHVALRVEGGTLVLRSYTDSMLDNISSVRADGADGADGIPVRREGTRLLFDDPLHIEAGQELRIYGFPS